MAARRSKEPPTPEELEYLEALEVEAAHLAQEDLATFVRLMWPVVEPGNGLDWNWHLDIICDELMKVTRGETQNLVINIPPGFMKSLLVSVFWPAWEWLHRPWERSQYLSGSNSVVKRDSRRTRDIIQSQDYRRLCKILGVEWGLAKDQNEKLNFANTAGGQRQCMTIGGKITGDRGDKQVCDDPYDVKEAIRGTQQRITERMLEVVETWDTVLANRLNDIRTNPRVLIMQRVDTNDLAGTLIARGWDHVVLQCEYDPSFPLNHPDDPRTEPGELLFPKRFPRKEIEKKKEELGWHFSAQYNQDPKNREGGMYRRAWFYEDPKKKALKEAITYKALPDLSSFDAIFQSWDFSKGSTSSTASYSIGHIFAVKWPNLWLFPVEKRKRCGFLEMKEMVEEMDREHPEAHLKLVENKASGPEVVADLRSEIPGFILFEPAGHGAKDERFDVASECPAGGNLMIPDRSLAPWIDAWIAEMCALPAEPNDRGDTFSQAYIWAKARYGNRSSALGKALKSARAGGKSRNPFSG